MSARAPIALGSRLGGRRLGGRRLGGSRLRVTCLAVSCLAVTGCEGVSLEIVQLRLADGTIGAPGAVGWEVRVDAIGEPGGETCPRPSAHRFDAPPIWVPAGGGVVSLEGLALSPGRYVASAIGRDPECRALYFARTCFGPEAPPRVIMLTACEVAGSGCVDFGWLEEDRQALACSAASCSVGRCE